MYLIKLHRVLAERDELQISLDSYKRKHQEEMEVIQNEHGYLLMQFSD